MFGVVAYIGACMGVSGAITLLFVLSRPIHTRDDQRSWRLWIGLFVASIIAPYAFFEVMTRTVGAGMQPIVESTLDAEGIQGELRYYKVLFYTGKRAWVVAVGTEKTVWGGNDSPVVRMVLDKSGKEWELVSSNTVYSDNKNLDGIVFPPFW